MGDLRTAALVDLDDTLLQYRVEEDAAQAALATAMGVGAAPNWDEVYRWAKDAARRGSRDGEDRLVRRIRMAASALGIEASVNDVQRLRRIYVDARVSAVTMLPGAQELLGHLRATFDAVLICTVGVEDLQLARIHAAGLEDGLDDVLVSDTRGVGKEDWPAFLGGWFRPSCQYVVISDCEVPDLAAARAAGMFTIGIGDDTGAANQMRAEDPLSLVGMLENTALTDRMERHYRRELEC